MSMENQPSQPVAQHAVQQPQVQQPEDEINLMDLLLVIAKHNRFILKFTVAAAALSVIYALLQPNVYTAKVMIMPPQQSQSSAASMMMAQIGAFGGLTGMDKSPSGLYMAMLKSRTVADALIDRFKLMELYETKTYGAVRKALEGAVTITAGKEGMITVEFDDKDAKRAADIANGYIDELDNLVRTLAVTEASRRRLFFEKQLKETQGNLESAELAMKQMQEKTGVIQLEGQSGAILGAEAGLRAQIAAKEIELSAMRAFATEQNPDYRRTEQMIASLRGQLSKVEHDNQVGDGEMTSKGKIPAMAVEYIHKMRDLKYYEGLFAFVAQQVASAKLDEAKDAAVIQVVDKALPPEKKSKPKRALIVQLATILAFFIGIFWAFFKEASERARQNPEQAERISLLHRYFWQGK